MHAAEPNLRYQIDIVVQDQHEARRRRSPHNLGVAQYIGIAPLLIPVLQDPDAGFGEARHQPRQNFASALIRRQKSSVENRVQRRKSHTAQCIREPSPC